MMNELQSGEHGPPALSVQGVQHAYGEFTALRSMDLQINPGEIFALLGPNGSGKTTLFRLISTLMKVQQGTVSVFGVGLSDDVLRVRQSLGIVFQAASLDPKLTVVENIRCQATLYGLRGQALQERIEDVLRQMGITDRRDTPTEQLSGGLKRRVELAKGILHRPRLLLMDEPSTGLDPASRLDLWRALKDLQQASGVTVLLTTHLLEEAEKADRIAIMHAGAVVALGRPRDLRRDLGEQVLSVETTQPAEVLAWLQERAVDAQQVDDQLRVVGSQAAALLVPLSEAFGERIQSLTLGRPSLEDVFVARTGHRFWNAEQPAQPVTSKRRSRRH